MSADFSPHFDQNSSERRDFAVLFTAYSSNCNGKNPSTEKAKGKPDSAVADAPRFFMRTGFTNCVRLSSKSRILLTSCPGSGAQNPCFCHRLSFLPQIHDSHGTRLTFCKMSSSLWLTPPPSVSAGRKEESRKSQNGISGSSAHRLPIAPHAPRPNKSSIRLAAFAGAPVPPKRAATSS